MTTSVSTVRSTSTSIAVLGAGRVGRALATALAGAGHHVNVGVRDPDTARAGELDAAIAVSTAAAAIAGADLVVNATPGDSTLERLSGHHQALAGKVLLDVSNATVRTPDGLPGGLLYPDVSLGELLQEALPGTSVVKGLNTMLFTAMTNPAGLATAPTAFLSGDDAAAKSLVRDLLQDLGWRGAWIVDLGGIGTARGTEAMALMVPSLLSVLGFAPFALSVAR